MRLFVALLAVALLVAACGGASRDMNQTMQAASVKSTLDTLWAQYADAADRRDSVLFGSLFVDDAALVYSSAPTMNGKPAIQQFLFTLYSGVDLTKLRVVPEDLRVDGDLAVQSGAFQEDYQDGANSKSEVGRFTLVAQKGSQGRWQIRRLVAIADSIKGGASAPNAP
jgi:ketosteroid isomerase-like protein